MKQKRFFFSTVFLLLLSTDQHDVVSSLSISYRTYNKQSFFHPQELTVTVSRAADTNADKFVSTFGYLWWLRPVILISAFLAVYLGQWFLMWIIAKSVISPSKEKFSRLLHRTNLRDYFLHHDHTFEGSIPGEIYGLGPFLYNLW